MVINFWSLGTIILNFCEFLCLWTSEGNIFSTPTLIVTILFILLCYIGWKSTDTPGDIPTPPLPPFLISIQTTTNSFGNVQRHTLQDIRLFSPQPYISRVVHQIQSRRVERGAGDSSSEVSPQTNNNGSVTPGGTAQTSAANSSPSSYVFNRFWSRPRQGTLGPTRSFRTFLRSRFHSPVLFYRLFPRHRHQPAPTVAPLATAPRREVVTNVTEIPSLTTNQGSNPSTTDILDPPVLSRPDTNQVSGADTLSHEGVIASVTEEALTGIRGDQKEEPEMDNASTPEGQQIKFTIKFLNDTQLEVVTSENEKIENLKRRHFSQELSENKVVRLIFNGRIMDNNRTLKESGFFESCVVHCLIFTPQPTSPLPSQNRGGTFNNGPTTPDNNGHQNNNNNSRGPEPGMFCVSLMGVILISLWFICFNFGQQLFTQSAVVSLSVLTGIFIIGLVAFYLPVHPAGVNNGNRN